MKITKKSITASTDSEMMFWCPKCHNQAVTDVDTEVHQLLDLDYQDHCVCNECGAEFLGEVTHDLKVKLTPIDEKVTASLDSKDRLSFKLRNEIYEVLDDCGGYTDYNQKIEDVVDEFGLSPDMAEGVVWDWSLNKEAEWRDTIDEEEEESDYEEDVVDEEGLYAATNTCNIPANPEIIEEDEQINTSITAARRISIKDLHDDVQDAAINWFKTSYGDPDITLNDINEMLVVDINDADDGRTIVEVRAELSYDGMWELAEVLNPIVAKYDKEAYFDMEEPGIMTAYLDPDGIYSSAVVNVPKTAITASIGPEDIDTDLYYTDDDERSMNIKVFSGGHADGFEVTIMDNLTGRTLFHQKYYYGRDASWSRESANADTPYVGDIIEKLRNEYGAWDVEVEAGKNLFSGKPVSEQTVERFRDYIQMATEVTATVSFKDWLLKKYNLTPSDLTEEDTEIYQAEYDNLKEVTEDLDTVMAASYGGAYDIEDDQYFTRDDLNEFGEAVAELISLDTKQKAEYAGAWIDNNILTAEFMIDDFDYEVNIKIDMRKIRRPNDLVTKYGDAVATKYVDEYQKYAADLEPEVTEEPVEEIESSEDIEADQKMIYPGDYYNPPEYEDPYDISDDELFEPFELEINVDDIAIVNLDGRWEWETMDAPWAEPRTDSYMGFQDVKVENGVYYLECPNDDLYVVDGDVVYDQVNTLLTDRMPEEPGKYHVKARVQLVYTFSETYGFYDDYDNVDIVLVNDVDVTYDKNASEIVRFTADRIE